MKKECTDKEEYKARSSQEKRDSKNWCTSLTGFLMLTAGGQRPQVFSQLQVSPEHELETFTDPHARRLYVKLRTVDEKRRRHLAFSTGGVPCISHSLHKISCGFC